MKADWLSTQRGSQCAKLLGQNTKLNICEAVADIFRSASLTFEMLRYQPQIVTQRFVALFDVVSNFPAFKLCDSGVGDPSPSHPLPFLQLTYLAVQNIRLSHAGGPFKRLTLTDSSIGTIARKPILRKFLLFSIAPASIAFGVCSPAAAQTNIIGGGMWGDAKPSGGTSLLLEYEDGSDGADRSDKRDDPGDPDHQMISIW
jgi:hypothetical protein